MVIRASLAPDGAHLLVRFPYDPQLVEFTRLLPGRRFDRKLQGWTVPLTDDVVRDLEGHYPGHDVEVDGAVRERLDGVARDGDRTMRLKTGLDETKLPDGMVFPTTQPMAHQVKALALGAARPRFAFLMQPGTGKTLVALGLLRWLKSLGQLRPALVVAPASVLSVWENQCRQHQPELRLEVLTGSVSARVEQLRRGWLAGVDVFVLNYEAVWRMEKELAALPWKVLILDESHRIKGRTTKQAKALHRLGAGVPRKYLLTGTPMPNQPLELFSQFFFLDPTILGPHFFAFRDRYAVMGGYQGRIPVAWRNIPELMEKVARHSYRVLKSECLDLPAKVFEVRDVEMKGAQAKAYKELAKNLVTEIQGKPITAPVVLAKLTKLREILAGFILDDAGVLHRFPEQAKRDALLDLLEDLPVEEKVVIWCQFREELAIIREVLPADKVVYLDGETPTAARGALVERFQTDPNCRFFLGQQKAGGLGITLTAASYAVFLSNDYSPDVRVQAEDRIHRLGQANRCTYFDLQVKGTLDVAIAAALRKKQKLADLVTGDYLVRAVDGKED